MQTLRKATSLVSNMRMIKKLFLQGLLLTIVLVVVQFGLDGAAVSFMSYMPPIGFALLMVLTYLIQPLLIGVINIIIINVLFKTRGWQVGFWVNGIFLLLAFTTINMLLKTLLTTQFTLVIALIDICVFSLPFGCIARFSNGGWKKPID